MRISDIDTIRGDREAQKPFVAFGAGPDATFDPAEPYGEEPKRVCTIEVTSAEKNLLLAILDEKRKVYLRAMKETSAKRQTHRRAEHQHLLVNAVIGKLKG